MGVAGDPDHDTTLEKSMREKAPIAINGATGTLGRAFSKICDEMRVPFRLLSREVLNLLDPVSIEKFLDTYELSAFINTAGYVRVDEAEDDEELCYAVNCEGPVQLAKACFERNIPFITFSSDLVFDGEKVDPYVERDRCHPLNVYGRSKAVAEVRVMEVHPRSLILRTSAFFGPWDSYNFPFLVRKSLMSGGTFTALEDCIVSPTYIPQLVQKTLELITSGAIGVRHVANRGEVSWLEFGRMIARASGLDEERVTPVTQRELGLRAIRPRYVALESEHEGLLEPLDVAVARFVQEVAAK